MKKIVLEQIGWHISGSAKVNMWGGGQGIVDIQPTFVPLDCLTKDNVHRCINDGGFGCESIERADVHVSEQYSYGRRPGSYLIYRTTLRIENPNPKLVCRGIQWNT